MFSLREDFERLPAFRQLTDMCGGEVVACYIWMRLWIELTYAATQTDKPGFLSAHGAKLYESSVPRPEAAFMSEYKGPLEWLVQAGVLRRDGESYYCEMFARANPHLARDFIPYAKRSNALSLVGRRQRQIKKLADETAPLLLTGTHKRRDGSIIDASLMNKTMVLIITLDRHLDRPARRAGEWGEGVIADAAEVAATHTPEQLTQFYRWMMVNRESPALPGTTEQILANYDRLDRLAQG